MAIVLYHSPNFYLELSSEHAYMQKQWPVLLVNFKSYRLKGGLCLTHQLKKDLNYLLNFCQISMSSLVKYCNLTIHINKNVSFQLISKAKCVQNSRMSKIGKIIKHKLKLQCWEMLNYIAKCYQRFFSVIELRLSLYNFHKSNKL